jgi:hypothetical protein
MSILVFAIGGASTSMEMWDGYLIVIALVTALTKMTVSEAKPVGHALIAARARNWRGRKRLKDLLETREAV